MMAAYSLAAANWDNAAHPFGPILSIASALPPTLAANVPFESGPQLQDDVLALRNACAWLGFCRDDGDGGRVRLGPQVCVSPLATLTLLHSDGIEWAGNVPLESAPRLRDDVFAPVRGGQGCCAVARSKYPNFLVAQV